MAKAETVRKATGRYQQEWYELLDGWGAPGRPYREIATWLTSEHGLSRWWAQKLIVEYEQDRGLRDPGARRNGSFEVGASKTVSAPLADLFAAFVDGRKRRSWLPEGKLTLQRSESPNSARFEWNSSSQVKVTFTKKASSKATVSVVHSGLPSAREAARVKQMWRDRLAALSGKLVV
ncbi:MAG TPA: DUF4287 domain-containing protein [Actinomycetota bacterium]|nr:DUF4287 domain-containing protein [Actinomycetota bacterium]